MIKMAVNESAGIYVSLHDDDESASLDAVSDRKLIVSVNLIW